MSRLLALFALWTATALSCAAILVALDPFAPSSAIPAGKFTERLRPSEPDAAAALLLQGDTAPRLAFVSMKPSILPTADDPLGIRDIPDDMPSAWSADIRLDRADQQRRPSLNGPTADRLPWKSAPSEPRLGNATLKQRVAALSPTAERRLAEKFIAAGVAWPPAAISLVAIKDEKAIELHVRGAAGPWQYVHRYPVLAASGGIGPKLRQGDHQVPEGVYGIALLNPNSRYHVSLRVNYPNSFDRQMAAKDGRANLGGDIMIHGKALSAGCLAVGDPAAEELFVLANRVGLANVKVVIAPTDFRRNGMPELSAGQPAWVPGLYAEVAHAMTNYKAPPSPSLLSFFWK